MTDDVFAGDPPAPTVGTIIGDNGKYKTVELAEAALIEKDRFIEQLKRENAEARDAVTKRINEEEFLDRMERLAQPTPPAIAPQGNERDEGPAVVTLETVEKVIEEREAAKSRKANLDAVQATLSGVYGTDWKARVQTIAKELGVGTDYLTSVAAKSPKAFYAVAGIQPAAAAPVDNAPPRSSVVIPPVAPNGGAKDYAYWKAQRETKGENWYFSTSVQKQMWDEVKSQGETKFYARTVPL